MKKLSLEIIKDIKNKKFKDIKELCEYFNIVYSAWFVGKQYNGFIYIEDKTAENKNEYIVRQRQSPNAIRFKWDCGLFNEYGQRWTKEEWENNYIVPFGVYAIEGVISKF